MYAFIHACVYACVPMDGRDEVGWDSGVGWLGWGGRCGWGEAGWGGLSFGIIISLGVVWDWIDGVDGWMDAWMDGSVDGWLPGWMAGWMKMYSCPTLLL